MAPDNADEAADKALDEFEGIVEIDEGGCVKRHQDRGPLILRDPKGEY